MNDPKSQALSATQRLIVDECNALRDLLLQKNKRCGDSAIHPMRLFAQASPLEQIAVRIDDKLSRIKNMGGLDAVLGAQAPDGEDTVQDLLGYLILARVAQRAGSAAFEEPEVFPAPPPQRPKTMLLKADLPAASTPLSDQVEGLAKRVAAGKA